MINEVILRERKRRFVAQKGNYLNLITGAGTPCEKQVTVRIAEVNAYIARIDEALDALKASKNPEYPKPKLRKSKTVTKKKARERVAFALEQK